MIITLARPSLLTTVAFTALVGLTAIPGAPAYAAAPSTVQPSEASRPTYQNDALDAVAQARIALQHRQGAKALDQIERAEIALLNLTEIDHEPNLTDALHRVQAARAALNHNDTTTVEQQLAAVSQDLTTAFASRMPPATPQLAVGASVYDPSGKEIGPIATIVFDPSDQVQSVVISVGNYLGSGEKYVAVPSADVKREHDRLTLASSANQLRQAQDYWNTQGSVGSGTPPRQ
jgi:sporulation protein YlmC with PRC-barrel domain